MSDDSDTATGSSFGVGCQRFEWQSADEWSVAVVGAVANATGRDPEALPPLQAVIDADALGALLEDSTASIRVSFLYADVEVTIDAEGTIELRPA